MDRATIEALKDKAFTGWPLPEDARFPPSAYYKFLYYLTLQMKARTCVELGVCGGGATRAMCTAQIEMHYVNGVVFGVDLDHAWDERMQQLRAEHVNFQFFFGDSAWAGVQKYQELNGEREVDLLFIDTTHTRERTLDEFAAWRSVLAPEAVVAFDDVERPGMPDAIQEILADEIPGKSGWEYIPLRDLHHESGFGVMIPRIG